MTSTQRGKPLDATTVRQVFDYDPDTGVLTWRRHARRETVGKVAGWLEANGRIKVSFRGKNYQAHRIIWLWVHGRWPVNEMDHINRNPADNRIINLREATHSQNGANKVFKSATGFKGVTVEKRTGKFRASIWKNNNSIGLGTFSTAEAAAAAYLKAAKDRWGDFACTATK